MTMGSPAPVSAAAVSTAGALSQAQTAFSEQNYENVIALLRKYLRTNGKDYHAWNLLAASYYHIGLPKRALRYLQTVEKKTTELTFNLYYQGLSQVVLQNTPKAEDAFQRAANTPDEYGSRCIFELAVSDYNQRETERARYWLNAYLQRAPQGSYRARVLEMIKSLDDNAWLEDVQGAPRPNSDEALYRHSKLSLANYPHFWIVRLGYQGENTTSMEPASNGTLGERQEANHAIDVFTGVGIGPVRKGDSTLMGGYNYRQLWNTDESRLSTYMQDPTDFSYQPFQTDMMERYHQFWGDARYSLQKRYFLGLFGRMEFARIGSSYFSSPDDSELRRVFPISDTTLLIPWVGISWYKDFRTSLYLYFRKEINQESPEHSNKTYSFSSPIATSVGLSHSMDFKPINTSADIELFRYEFIYNDYWLDYTRMGGIVSAEHYLVPSLAVSLLGGYYTDTYELPRIKLHDCSTKPKGSEAANSGDLKPRTCPRVDSGMMVQGELDWYYTQFLRVSGSVLFVQNQNPDMQEFQQVRQIYKAGVTMAFPSIKRVIRFVERFADTAFTKEAQ